MAADLVDCVHSFSLFGVVLDTQSVLHCSGFLWLPSHRVSFLFKAGSNGILVVLVQLLEPACLNSFPRNMTVLISRVEIVIYVGLNWYWRFPRLESGSTLPGHLCKHWLRLLFGLLHIVLNHRVRALRRQSLHHRLQLTLHLVTGPSPCADIGSKTFQPVLEDAFTLFDWEWTHFLTEVLDRLGLAGLELEAYFFAGRVESYLAWIFFKRCRSRSHRRFRVCTYLMWNIWLIVTTFTSIREACTSCDYLTFAGGAYR